MKTTFWKRYGFIPSATLCVAVVFTIVEKKHDALSSIIGGALSLFVLWFSLSVSRAVLNKKSFASAGIVIVFKYAIFGLILWQTSANGKLAPAGFFLGFLTLIPGLYFVSLTEQHFGQKKVAKVN